MLNPIKTLKSFNAAFAGIKIAVREANMRMHILAAIVVIALGLFYKLSPGEWATIALAISVVMAMEIVNSAIEEVADVIKEKLQLDYEDTRDIRDLGAAGVLFSSIGALVIGLIVFVPKVIETFQNISST